MIDPFVFQLAVLALLGYILAYVVLLVTDTEDNASALLIFVSAMVPTGWMIIELARLST